jgi:hypothetical protein
MKSPAVIGVVAALALLSAGCGKKKGELEGVCFSNVAVSSLTPTLTMKSVVLELSNASAQLDVPDAPIIFVAEDMSLTDGDKAIQVTLTALTSDGFFATGESSAAVADFKGDEVGAVKSLVSNAARKLILGLAKNIRERRKTMPAPIPEEPPVSEAPSVQT